VVIEIAAKSNFRHGHCGPVSKFTFRKKMYPIFIPCNATDNLTDSLQNGLTKKSYDIFYTIDFAGTQFLLVPVLPKTGRMLQTWRDTSEIFLSLDIEWIVS